MARHLKRWESPRREGRNDRGRGGTARQRQKRKQLQALRKKLKQAPPANPSGRSPSASPFLMVSGLAATAVGGLESDLQFGEKGKPMAISPQTKPSA